MKHYYITDHTQHKGLIEVTEVEWNAIIGTEETRLYASSVYRGTLSIDEASEELCSSDAFTSTPTSRGNGIMLAKYAPLIPQLYTTRGNTILPH